MVKKTPFITAFKCKKVIDELWSLKILLLLKLYINNNFHSGCKNDSKDAEKPSNLKKNKNKKNKNKKTCKKSQKFRNIFKK